jgi:hypothetical protein
MSMSPSRRVGSPAGQRVMGSSRESQIRFVRKALCPPAEVQVTQQLSHIAYASVARSVSVGQAESCTGQVLWSASNSHSGRAGALGRNVT